MSAPVKTGKGGSRWGGFLQQAVASVESRLDNILAEDEASAAKSTGPAPEAQQAQQARTTSSTQIRAESRPDELARTSSNSKINDRLQERLAKAIARSNSPRPTDSVITTPTSTLSRSGTPVGDREGDFRLSVESDRLKEAQEDTGGTPSDIDASDQTLPQNKPNVDFLIPSSDSAVNASVGSSIIPTPSPRTSVEVVGNAQSGRSSTDVTADRALGRNTEQTSPDAVAEALTKLRVEHDEAEKKWQEELHGYTERMDAMQAKLLYLTKEVSGNAHNAAANAPVGSIEKKLLERDEKIALLMEEGQKLSRTELNHMTTIKKLRAQAIENQKIQKDLRLQIQKVEQEKQKASDRARRAELGAKRVEEQVASSSRNDKEHDALTKERDALTATVIDMKSQLARALVRAEAAENKAQTDALEKERRKVADLEENLNSHNIEHELKESKLRREIKELGENLEKEKGLTRALEAELRGEQTAMERKMESLRSRAEEVTSSGDGHAKLLRQIETLQTQYAVASDNWQGIEGSLMTKLANMEKERDDAVSREEGLRRRARDASSKAKKLDVELEKAHERIAELEKNLLEVQSELHKLTRKLDQTSDAMDAAKKDFESQLHTQEAMFTQRLEEERLKWREQGPMHSLTADSSVLSVRKNSANELSHLSVAPSERVQGRRSSAWSGQIFVRTPPRQDSLTSISRSHSQNPVLETPSLQSYDRDEFLSGPATPLSPPMNGVNDLVSVSTVGAGPSVQLVERMSANVRRLESERAASKDEIARLAAQRDEAREEIVQLMREAEQKRAVEEKMKMLEEEAQKTGERYQTTLEMLGEKSELVEELKADVADLKKMYRELVDATMK